MSRINVGTDIESVARFRKSPFSRNKGFYMRIFTEKEIAYCCARPDPSQSFAARFAAKEAVVKAVPLLREASLSDIEIVRSGLGELSIHLVREKKGVNAKDISISVSHTKDYAVAFALYARGKK